MRRSFNKKFARIFTVIVLMIVLIPALLNARTKSVTTAYKTGHSPSSFISEIAPRAQELGEAYGIYPSVIIAQAAYESNYGQTLLSGKYHNLMKLKAVGSQESVSMKETVERESGDSLEQVSHFAVYSDWNECLDDYLSRLQAGDTWTEDLYTNLVSAGNYETATNFLQVAGFSTDENYAASLNEIIKKYDLTQYDK